MNVITSPSKSLKIIDQERELNLADIKKIQSSTVFSNTQNSIKIIGNLPTSLYRRLSVSPTSCDKNIGEPPSSNFRRESVFETNDVKFRYDSKGNPITRGKFKKQRVTFRDLISKEKLVEFINIPKELNKDNDTSKPKEKDTMSCACLMF
jgi:hypothetical protein